MERSSSKGTAQQNQSQAKSTEDNNAEGDDEEDDKLSDFNVEGMKESFINIDLTSLGLNLNNAAAEGMQTVEE